MDDQLSAKRAVAVLNAAMKCSMLPEGAIPESDSDKLVEAEKIITLARQAKAVADQIGSINVPNYQGIINVLSEAEVFLGIGSAEHEAAIAAQQSPSAPADSGGGDGDGTGTEQSAPAPVATPEAIGHIDALAKPATNEKIYIHEGCDGDRSAWMVPLDGTPPPQPGTLIECANCAQQAPFQTYKIEEPPAPAPVSDPPGSSDDPTTAQPNELWIDGNGQIVKVCTYAGGPQVEVEYVATGEKTVVPIGLLKCKHQGESPSSAPSPPPPPTPGVENIGRPPAATTPAPEPSATSSPAPSEVGGPASAPSLPEQPTEPRQDTGPVDDDEGDQAYRQMLDEVEANYKPIGMPTPMDLERPPEGMPEDLTAISDINARRLHSQFNALAARARFLFGLEQAKAKACERFYKQRIKAVIKEAREEAPKDATLTEVTMIAEQHADVEPWITRQQRHADRAESYKTFLAFYTDDVSVLSRDWTMRAAEEQGS